MVDFGIEVVETMGSSARLWEKEMEICSYENKGLESVESIPANSCTNADP